MKGQSMRRLWLPLVIVLGVLVLLWIARELPRRHRLDPEALPRVITARGDLAADEQATIALFRNTSPSVAYITTLALRRDVFSLNLFEIPQGTGSGFVWSQEGHILTNFHVVQGASGARVTVAGGSTWDARLVGVAPDQDLALLMIDAPASRLRPIPIGTSAALQVGQKVFAIGNPFGVEADPVTSQDTLTETLGKFRVGDTAKVTILRAGNRLDVEVTLQALK